MKNNILASKDILKIQETSHSAVEPSVSFSISIHSGPTVTEQNDIENWKVFEGEYNEARSGLKIQQVANG